MKMFSFFLPAAGAVALAAGAFAQPAAPVPFDNRPIKIELQPDHAAFAPDGEYWGLQQFSNSTVPLGLDRPAAVTREPTYNGTPLYGVIRLGNSAKSNFHVVVDHPRNGAWSTCRVYVDANRNGDLADDGDGAWGNREVRDGGPAARLGPKVVTLRASYSSGRNDEEVRARDYAIMLMYLKASADRPMQLTFRRATAQVGKVTVGNKSHRVMIVENDNDAIYLFNKGDAGKPMWMFVDADDDGKFSEAEQHDMRGGVAFGGRSYIVRPASDGSLLMLTPFNGPLPDRKAARDTPRQPQIELLANGTAAPDFEALRADGSKFKLSDYRGKVVVLDFWATWCGPCKASMPSLEELHRKTEGQGVAVLGLCVWDKREAFEKWLAAPQVKTTYALAFDPVGTGGAEQNADSIAKKLYNATAIPTFYVIDREGKIAASYVGSGNESKKGLQQALTKLGIKL